MLPPGDPAGRSVVEVCAAWRAGHVENAATPWTAGPDTCDLGTVPREAIDDCLRRVNLFRWLAGLEPTTDDAALNEIDQHCAVMMNANGQLDHTPPESWACYTAQGAQAAGQSNLALGTRSPGGAIDLYMADGNTPSLGHRRWILNGPLRRVGIGFAGRAQCLHVFDRSGADTRRWTAYPNPGPAPLPTTRHLWSLHSGSFSLSGADVTVELVRDGSTLPIMVSHPRQGYGPSTVSWQGDGWRPAADERYRVTVTPVSTAPITYEVHVVDC